MVDVLAAFAHVTTTKDGWTARCPAHDDRRNSLSISRGEDARWLLHCHAGCSLEAILAAVQLTTADLFVQAADNEPRRVVARYRYRDEHNVVLYEAVRYEPKGFAMRAPDGAPTIRGVRRVPYRLNELQGKRTVFIVEGEKDADRLWRLGLPATTNVGGAGKWRADYARDLRAAGCRQVVSLPDHDPPGETHARDVARSCVDAGLAVKLIALPGLPPKGDISNYLEQHSRDDLLALVKAAPLFTPARLVARDAPLVLTSIADFLTEPTEVVEWIVEDRIPAGGVVLFVAAPKVGKSTAARELAFAVSRGEPWLGWRTSAGPVWLLAFEDKRHEVRKHFRHLGADGGESLRFWIDAAPADLLPKLHALAATESPALIIIDTLARALKLKDFNDYSQVSQGFDPLLNLARETKATLLLLHHSSVHAAAREGLDAILGSTALAGSVDNIFVLKRLEQQRVLSSVQRIGPDLEPTVIALNPDTGRLERAGSKRAVDDRALAARVLAAFRAEPSPKPESWLQGQVEGRKADIIRVLRQLLGQRLIYRSGEGKRKDPYLYRVAAEGLAENTGSRESGTRNDCSITREPEKPQNSADFPGLFCERAFLVPDPLSISREPETKNQESRTYVLNSHYVPVCVPDGSANRDNGQPKTTKQPNKTGADSGSRESEDL